MWEITDASGGKLTMLGSMHMGKKDIFPLADRITKPYNEAQALVIECDATSPAAAAKVSGASVMRYSDGTLLKDKLSAEAYKIFTDKLAAMNMTDEMFKNFKPWAAYETIDSLWLLTSGLNTSYSIDEYLINLSKSNKKEIIELESVESQLEVYTKAPDITFDAQFKMLRDETRESYHKQINQLYDAWVTGDTDTVYKLSAGGTDADYAKAGLTAEEIAAVKKFNSSIKGDRNIKMAEKLEKLLKEGKKAFVMIGAAHFLGDDSIISLLEAKGYKAKRI